MFFTLAIKNIVSRKSSVVIVLFIAFAIALLVLTNAIFDCTENGIQEAYVSSFTGDVVIRPKNESPLSLLGDETPITGSFTEIPLLFPFEELSAYLKTIPQIVRFSPLISGIAALDFNGQKFPSIVFGAETSDYLGIMNAIALRQGRAYGEDEDGIMLSTQIAEKIGAGLSSDLQFIVSEGLSARIRTAPVTGIYEYPIANSIFDEIVLMNPETARELLGMDSFYKSDDVVVDEMTESLLSDYDLDSLFDGGDDFFADVAADDFEKAFGQSAEDFSVADGDFADFSADAASAVADVGSSVAQAASSPMDAASSDSAPSPSVNDGSGTSWNFIICQLASSKDVKKVIRLLNKKFKKSEWSLEAVNWRSAAGSNAMYLYFLRLILNVGIIIVLFAGFIIINNTLVLNILDRIQEIGTMRAIGTSKAFVSLQCMTETLILSFTAGLLGLVLGSVFSRLLLAAHVTFSNAFLIQLFGGNVLVTVVKAQNLLKCFAVAFVLGMVAWIYPVRIALGTSPVTAMTGAK